MSIFTFNSFKNEGFCPDCHCSYSECDCREPVRGLISGEILADSDGKLLPDWKERMQGTKIKKN